MKLATIRCGEVVSAALVGPGDVATPIDYRDAQQALEAEVRSTGAALSSSSATRLSPEQYELLAPLPRPGKILGSGINYASHRSENPQAVMPTEPGFFSKFPSSVIGPGAEVILPAPESQVDYEVELAVVIGRPGKNISRADADRHVFGYTLINDISGRDIQFRPNQMDLGKGLDTFCPMGPWLVSADEIDDINDVRLRSWVNGELRQDASTSEWLYDVPALLEHASRYLTLQTGDLITTGTPAGCGTFRTPPLWLQPGDVVRIEGDGLGALVTPVASGW